MQNHSLLSIIGIETWHCREQQQIASVTHYHRISLLDAALLPAVELIADAQPDSGYHAAEQSLLHAIAFALEAQCLPQQAVQTLPLGNLLDKENEWGRRLILFGPAVTYRMLGDDLTFFAVRGHSYALRQGVAYITCALSDLLSKPMLKKQIWKELAATLR